MISLAYLALTVATVVGGFVLVARVFEFGAKLAGSADPLEDGVAVLFGLAVVVGIVAPPIAILWMAIA